MATIYDSAEEEGRSPSRRGLRMLCGDTFLNNTDYHLGLIDFEGNQIVMLDPGGVFAAPVDTTIFFDANPGYSFRAYVGQGYGRNDR